MTCKKCEREFKQYRFTDGSLCYPCAEKLREKNVTARYKKNQRIIAIRNKALAQFAKIKK